MLTVEKRDHKSGAPCLLTQYSTPANWPPVACQALFLICSPLAVTEMGALLAIFALVSFASQLFGVRLSSAVDSSDTTSTPRLTCLVIEHPVSISSTEISLPRCLQVTRETVCLTDRQPRRNAPFAVAQQSNQRGERRRTQRTFYPPRLCVGPEKCCRVSLDNLSILLLL